MSWNVMVVFFTAQLIMAAGVFFFLKRNLNRELILCAIERFTVMEITSPVDQVVVESYKPLIEAFEYQLKSIALRRFPKSEVSFSVNPELKAGIVIRLADQAIDFSLVGRLKKSASGA